MLISNSKLQKIIQQVLSEARELPPGFSITSGGGGGGGGGGMFKQFAKEILAEISEITGDVQNISVVDPDAIEQEYGGITDDVYNSLNNIESNVIYNSFGKQPYQDNIQNLFTGSGPTALKDFFQWAKADFASYAQGDLNATDDSVSAFYTAKDGKERQVTIMFF